MRKLFNINFFLVLFAPIIYSLVALVTISDYGINWDDSKHFIRGQSYLHFILTGKRDFLDLSPYPAPKGAPDFVNPNVEPPYRDMSKEAVTQMSVRRSYYQSDFYTFDYFMTKHVHTHPEVNDLLVAFSNYVFFQKLGIVGDIEAYHLFIVFVTFALLTGVGLLTYRQWGVFASIVATASLGLYPMVFAESHFNIKDPILMSFFGLAILTFWFGFSKGRLVYLVLSALFAGFALGTKFNTLFLPFVLGPWAVFILIKRFQNRGAAKLGLLNLLGGPKILLGILAYPFIALGTLYAFSPYLWFDPFGKFMGIVNYYRDIGVGAPEELSSYLIGGWNTYPLVWILYTTPLPVLFLSIIGFCYSLFLIVKKRSDTAFLVLLWLIVPIGRVVWPGTNIYGGARQIMEFVPAMAILAGIGGGFLVRGIRKVIGIRGIRMVGEIIILLLFVPHLFVMFKLHPNQNVYFNQLVGGLKGVREKNVPSWGNSFGNVYLQGIEWLNQNAGKDAKLALAVNYISTIPRLKLRQDISLDNSYWSGPDRKGEYVMEMYYDWPLRLRYKYSYYETFLEPVYQVRVDGVPILKIWKNDPAYVYPGYEREISIKPLSVRLEEDEVSPGVIHKKLRVDFAKQVFLTQLTIDHSTSDCEKELGDGFIAVSEDGLKWTREPGPLYDPESPYASQGMDEDTFVFMFPARPARSVIFNSQKENPCILENYNLTILGLDK